MSILSNIEFQPIDPQILANIIQIWEFFQRWNSLLKIKTNFSIDDIKLGFIDSGNKTDILHYLLFGAFSYIYREIILFKHSSNYYLILDNLQCNSIRNYLIYQTWPIFFNNLLKCPKIKHNLQDDIKEQFNTIKQSLQDKEFDEFNSNQKIKLFLFIINWVIYESESFAREMDEVTNLMNEFIPQQQLRVKKQWQIQLSKLNGQIEEKQNEMQVHKRRNRKQQNRKTISLLENEVQEHQSKKKWIQKILGFDDEDMNRMLQQQCRLIGQTEDGIQFWLLEGDNEYFYLRNMCDDWYQVRNDQIQKILINLGDQILSINIKQLLNQNRITEIKIEQANNKQFFVTENIEEIIQNKLNLEFIKVLKSTNDYMCAIKSILKQTEEDYSEYEINYWRCCWQSKEKRQIWTAMVNSADDLQTLQTIIAKIPHQLSFVNKKHVIMDQDQDTKYRSYRLYWFYQNKEYSNPYQSLAKEVPERMNLLVLSLSLYEKLTLYINKKINQIALNEIQQKFTDSEQVDEVKSKQEENIPLTNRLRQRKIMINYSEKKQENSTSDVKVQIKSYGNKKSNSSTPLIEIEELEKFAYGGILRSRKKIVYDE